MAGRCKSVDKTGDSESSVGEFRVNPYLPRLSSGVNFALDKADGGASADVRITAMDRDGNTIKEEEVTVTEGESHTMELGSRQFVQAAHVRNLSGGNAVGIDKGKLCIGGTFTPSFLPF